METFEKKYKQTKKVALVAMFTTATLKEHTFRDCITNYVGIELANLGNLARFLVTVIKMEDGTLRGVVESAIALEDNQIIDFSSLPFSREATTCHFDFSKSIDIVDHYQLKKTLQSTLNYVIA